MTSTHPVHSPATNSSSICRFRRSRSWAPGLAVVALSAAAFLSATAARADEWLDKANAPFKTIATDKRSDTIILPVLAKIEEAPGLFAKPDMAALIPASSDQFKAAADWAQAEPQKAVLEGLRKVTTDDPKADWKKVFAFGQPYGSQDVDPDMYTIKMYTELGEPATLAGPKILYLPSFTRLECLVQVEATRLAAAGKHEAALDLLVRFNEFARQIADRRYFAEQIWAYNGMLRAVERIRDIAYVAFRDGNTTLTPDGIRLIVRRLKDKNGIIGIDRLKLPEAEKFATLQIVGRIFTPGGGPNTEFSKVLARLGSRKHALRLFSEMAKWDAVAVAHENEKATRKFAEDVYNDWANRWELSVFEPKLKSPTDYTKMDKVRFAALDAMLGDISTLFNLRWKLQAEIVATRMSISHVGYILANKSIAPDYSAIRVRQLEPKEGDILDVDPFSREKLVPGFFVPIRDTKVNKGDDDKPYSVRIVVPGIEPFEKLLRNDTFVLYGRGPDLSDTKCTRATQMELDERGDYLMWPPLMSLYRERLDAEGKLP